MMAEATVATGSACLGGGHWHNGHRQGKMCFVKWMHAPHNPEFHKGTDLQIWVNNMSNANANVKESELASKILSTLLSPHTTRPSNT